FFRRYLQAFRQPAMRELSAGVPTLMIWDDHDIFDGWGSHPPALQDSPVARGLFTAAREMFVLFQLGGSPDALPETCPDRTGASFTQGAGFPGFSVLLPDLRSERTPTRVMGETGWTAFEATLKRVAPGDRQIVVSSVPALGPRLSLIESLLDFYPGQQQYEDDLRDQWQSRAHRAEWIRFLEALEREAIETGAVTVVSGEIHLATRAEMRLRDGSVLHQLVASGITHPKPPRAMAVGLGLLSRLGHAPLRGRPVRLKALPGQKATYTAERNFLVLERAGTRWTARWNLEESGTTAPLSL
ncbi:MAG: alkaline phosphatase D family protein, partial [Methylobacterium sp.]